MSDAKGTSYGDIKLLDLLGSGGMGSVYRAWNEATNEPVAIKIFRADSKISPERVKRMRDREAMILQEVSCPYVVKYFASGQADRVFFFTMEFVGDSLLSRMRGRELVRLSEKINILYQTACALRTIHGKGFVHGDIKPGNILLKKNYSNSFDVKLTDFGIAQRISKSNVIKAKPRERVPGTPKYLSPEQIYQTAVDGRADIFSLGIVAYEMLSGSPPFKADTTRDYLEANLRQSVEPLAELDKNIPPFVADMVERMLARDRDERYDSETLARDILQWARKKAKQS